MTCPRRPPAGPRLPGPRARRRGSSPPAASASGRATRASGLARSFTGSSMRRARVEMSEAVRRGSPRASTSTTPPAGRPGTRSCARSPRRTPRRSPRRRSRAPPQVVGYVPSRAASSALAQLVKYSILTIFPSRTVVSWWCISVSISATLDLPARSNEAARPRSRRHRPIPAAGPSVRRSSRRAPPRTVGGGDTRFSDIPEATTLIHPFIGSPRVGCGTAAPT